jgi:PAS domain-containing protein
MSDMTGYTMGEIIGRTLWEFVGNEDQSTVTMNMEKRRRGISDSYEIKLIRKDGSPIWVHVTHFRQVDVKIHLIYLLISIFLKRSEINFNKKLIKVDHNIINIYFITNEGHDNLDNKYSLHDTCFQ